MTGLRPLNRQFLRVFPRCLAAIVFAVPAGAGRYAFQQLEDRVEVRADGALFTAYRFADRRPCLYPVIGPGGRHLTRRWPLEPDSGEPESRDHPHHTGIWFAHGAVRPAGAADWADFWHQDRIVHQRFVDFEANARDDTLVAESAWTGADGAVLCRSRMRLRFGRDGDARWIDWETAITAPEDTAVVFGDTKEGTFALRVPESLTLETDDDSLRHLSQGHIATSEGVADGDAWGTRARWCVFHGPVEGHPTVIAILDHPDNPRHPTWWVARPYGLFGANPFGRSFFENAPAGAGDFTLPAGGTITFRHRVLFLAGDFAPAAVEAAYQAFAGWAPLGTGHDLTGWTSRPDLGHWSVSDGVITGANGPEKQGSVLWTDRTFGDFVLETDFRFSGTIDSGVFVKGERYQVNLGISSSLKVDKTCSIYAPEDGLGKYPGEAEGVADLLREGDWNTLRVEARGAHIRVGLNGQPVLDYEAKALPATGPIGLQVHPGLDMKVEFRNPRIRP